MTTLATQVPERPTGSHSAQEQALRRAIAKEKDPTTLRILHAFLDDLFVSKAHLRAADPEIKRLRRWLREAA